MVIFCFSFKNSSNEKKPETVESGLLRWTKNNNNLMKIQRYNFRFNHCECVHCTHCACTRVHYSMFTAFLLLYLHSLSAFYALWSRLLLHLCAQLRLNHFVQFILLFIRSTLDKQPNFFLYVSRDHNICWENISMKTNAFEIVHLVLVAHNHIMTTYPKH